MLDSQHYSEGVDIWAAGCTFYELMTGKPLFKCKHYLDLIKMFVKTLGTFDEETLKMIKNEQAVSYLKK